MPSWKSGPIGKPTTCGSQRMRRGLSPGTSGPCSHPRSITASPVCAAPPMSMVPAVHPPDLIASPRTQNMKSVLKIFAASVFALPLAALAQTPGPLVIKAQGSFFVGGEKKTVSQPASGIIPAQSGEITVNQMYVQYQEPMQGERHVPIVLVHGCCLSS